MMVGGAQGAVALALAGRMALARGRRERALQAAGRKQPRQPDADPAAPRLDRRPLRPRRSPTTAPISASTSSPTGCPKPNGRACSSAPATARPAARGSRRIETDIKRAAGFQPVQVAENLDWDASPRSACGCPNCPASRRPRGFSRNYPDGAGGRASDRLCRRGLGRAVSEDQEPAADHAGLQDRQGRARKSAGRAAARRARRQAGRGDRARQAGPRARDASRRRRARPAADDRRGPAGICRAPARHQFGLGGGDRRDQRRRPRVRVDAGLRPQQLFRRHQPSRMEDAVGQRPRPADEQDPAGALSAGIDGQADERAGAAAQRRQPATIGSAAPAR